MIDAGFYIDGKDEYPGDSLQPRVTVFMEFLRHTSVGSWAASTPRIRIQTTVSQRELDS